MAPVSIEEVLTWTKGVRNTIFTPYCGMQGPIRQLVDCINTIKSEGSLLHIAYIRNICTDICPCH